MIYNRIFARNILTMRITKELAEHVSDKLLAAKDEAIKTLKREIAQVVDTIVVETYPPEVTTFMQEYPGYVNTSTSFQLYGHGFLHAYFSASRPHPHKGSRHIQLTDAKKADKLFKLDAKVQKLEIELRNTRNELIELLKNFRTAKKAIAEFPECAPHFPKEAIPMPLSVDLSKIRNFLKN